MAESIKKISIPINPAESPVQKKQMTSIVDFYKIKVKTNNTSDYFSTNYSAIGGNIPKVLQEISNAVKKNDLQTCENLWVELNHYENDLNNNSQISALRSQGKDSLENCQYVVQTSLEYILCFYKPDENNNSILIKRDPEEIAQHIKSCLSLIEHLKNASENNTIGKINVGDKDKMPMLLQTPKKGSDSVPINDISLGYSRANLENILLNDLYAVLTENKDIGKKIIEQQYTSPNFRENLATHLDRNQDVTLLNLSRTFYKMKSFNNTSQQAKISKKILSESNNEKNLLPKLDPTKEDVTKLFNSLRKMEPLSFQDFTHYLKLGPYYNMMESGLYNQNELDKLYLHNKENYAFYIEVMKTKTVEINGVWGTYFDHVFNKFSPEDKSTFINELKNAREDSSHTLHSYFKGTPEIPQFLTGNDSAIEYINNLISNTAWDDREVGIQTFHELIFNIQTSHLNNEDKLFLIKDMIQNQLKLGSNGAFSAGSRKSINNSIATTAVLGASAVSVGVNAGIGKHTLPVVSAVIGSVNAISSFGVKIYLATGVSNSHQSKSKLAQEALYFLEKNISSKIEKEKNLSFKYNKFLSTIKDFQTLKKGSLQKKDLEQKCQQFHKDILNQARDFNELGISKFIFESNTSENCPLIDIIHSALNEDVLKKTGLQQESGKFLEQLFATIYQSTIDEKVSKIKSQMGISSNDNRINEDIFGVFLAEGFKNASTSKDKFLFVLQCTTLIDSQANQKKYKYILTQAIKNAEFDKSSYLYGLNHDDNSKSVDIKKAVISFVFDAATIGVLVAADLLAIPTLGFSYAGSAVIGAILGTLKSMVLDDLNYNKENYNLSKKLMDIKNNFDFRSLEAIEDNLETSEDLYSNKHLGFLIEKYTNKLNSFELQSDNIKLDKLSSINISNNSKEYEDKLMNEVNILLKNVFDKNSLNHAFMRAQRLILLSQLKPHEKASLIFLITENTLFSGENAQIMQRHSKIRTSELVYSAILGTLQGLSSLVVTDAFAGTFNFPEVIKTNVTKTLNFSDYKTKIAFAAGAVYYESSQLKLQKADAVYGYTKSYTSNLKEVKKILRVLNEQIIHSPIETDIQNKQKALDAMQFYLNIPETRTQLQKATETLGMSRGGVDISPSAANTLSIQSVNLQSSPSKLVRKKEVKGLPHSIQRLYQEINQSFTQSKYKMKLDLQTKQNVRTYLSEYRKYLMDEIKKQENTQTRNEIKLAKYKAILGNTDMLYHNYLSSKRAEIRFEEYSKIIDTLNLTFNTSIYKKFLNK